MSIQTELAERPLAKISSSIMTIVFILWAFLSMYQDKPTKAILCFIAVILTHILRELIDISIILERKP